MDFVSYGESCVIELTCCCCCCSEVWSGEWCICVKTSSCHV